MPLKNWCSIHARCSKSSVKHSIGFRGIFSKAQDFNLRQNMYRYYTLIMKKSNRNGLISSSSSRPDDSTGSLDSLAHSPSVPISHCSWQVLWNSTQCQLTADRSNFLLVGQYWCVYALESTRERRLLVRPHFFSSVQHESFFHRNYASFKKIFVSLNNIWFWFIIGQTGSVRQCSWRLGFNPRSSHTKV